MSHHPRVCVARRTRFLMEYTSASSPAHVGHTLSSNAAENVAKSHPPARVSRTCAPPCRRVIPRARGSHGSSSTPIWTASSHPPHAWVARRVPRHGHLPAESSPARVGRTLPDLRFCGEGCARCPTLRKGFPLHWRAPSSKLPRRWRLHGPKFLPDGQYVIAGYRHACHAKAHLAATGHALPCLT